MKYIEQVYCTLQIEGTHNWPNCPFDEVAYLRDPHRHVFHITAYKLVTHSDRDVEFIMLKHKIREYIRMQYWTPQTMLCEFGARSCEMIAKELIEQFGLIKCEVNEDNENGAVVSIDHGNHYDSSTSPYSQKPAYFDQKLYDEWLKKLSEPYKEGEESES